MKNVLVISLCTLLSINYTTPVFGGRNKHRNDRKNVASENHSQAHIDQLREQATLDRLPLKTLKEEIRELEREAVGLKKDLVQRLALSNNAIQAMDEVLKNIQGEESTIKKKMSQQELQNLLSKKKAQKYYLNNYESKRDKKNREQGKVTKSNHLKEQLQAQWDTRHDEEIKW